jgi:hypothetical protein
MGKVQEDCFYYVERKEGVPLRDCRILPMCTVCAAKNLHRSDLMFWEGTRWGYGPKYDVECSMPDCGRKIFTRE